MDSTRYRVNAPGVVEESIDGEVLIVNLDTGNYYSADKSGEVIWRLLAGGASGDEAVAALAQRYRATPAELTEAVRALLGQFLEDQLLVSADGVGRSPNGIPAAEREPAPFEAPALRKYTDMQELLLLDPVHEVDEEGWPNPKDGPPVARA